MISRQSPSNPTAAPHSGTPRAPIAHRRAIAAYPRWLKDIGIRCGGLMLLLVSALAFSWLYRLVHVVPRSEGTLGQYGIAAVAFLSASVGLGLVALGYSIHDPVEISDRWRSRL